MAANTNTPFVPECGCGRCAFDDCLAKRVAAGASAWTHPGVIGCLSFIKEISAGAPVPGLRSASGPLLVIVEQLASMQDSKLDLKILMQDCIDHSSVVYTCYKEATEKLDLDATPIPQAFHTQTQKLSEVLTAIADTAKLLLQRGRFIRFFYAKADREEIARLRRKLDHQIQNFTTFMVTENYINCLPGRQSAQPVAPTPTPLEAKPLSESDMDKIQRKLKNFSQTIGQHHYGTLLRRHEAEVRNQNNVTSHTIAPITTHGDNSPVNVVDSFKTTNHNVQNSNNDYSANNNTYNMHGSGNTVDNSKN